MKHTPGPWTLQPETACEMLGEYSIVADLESPEGPWHVATTHGFGDEGEAQAKANARLIAAAPALLAALEDIEALAVLPYAGSVEVHSILTKARAAIRSARDE